MFTQEELANSMQQLDTPEQIAVLEDLIKEHGINAETADVVAVFMMGVLLDLDGGEYPADLIKRATAIATGIREFNEIRFGASNGA